MEFYEKRNGVQLGSIAQLEMNSMKQRRCERRINDSSTTQQIDLMEMLLYKCLEEIRIGPVVHFFFQDLKDFYI